MASVPELIISSLPDESLHWQYPFSGAVNHGFVLPTRSVYPLRSPQPVDAGVVNSLGRQETFLDSVRLRKVLNIE